MAYIVLVRLQTFVIVIVPVDEHSCTGLKGPMFGPMFGDT